MTRKGNLNLGPEEFLYSKKQLMKKKNMIKEIEADGNWMRKKKSGTSGSHITYNSSYISDLITVPRDLKMNHILHNLNSISLARQIKNINFNIIAE
tara:strand:- start:292 stop:579 length:288 start_codon:yes stop_codon:yes gene_type:complete